LLASESSCLGVADLIEHGGTHEGHRTIHNFIAKAFQHDHIINENSDDIRSHAEHNDYLDEVIETVTAAS
jgi:hypothetical protein